MKKVCFFGIYNPNHWRTKTLRHGFINMGYEIVECRVDPRQVKGFTKYLELYKRYKNLNTKFDYILVGFPGYISVFVAKLMTSTPIIFDAYISYLDGIRDRRNYSVYHPRVWLAWIIDFLNGICSDVVLTINHTYKDFFIKTLRVKEQKVEVLHKGADEEIFVEQKKQNLDKDKYIIGWWGSFIPLHGVPYIIEAAQKLKNEKNIEFQLIGSGQLEQQIKKQIENNNLKNVLMKSFIPQKELIEKIAEFDIVLGIFSPTPKAGRCVTNKVFEAMAMGKPIITENSKANKEIFTHKVNSYLIPAGNPDALSKAILEILYNKELRINLGDNARNLFSDKFTLEKIDLELSDIINRYESR